MPRPLYLHVGTAKSGTTALQKAVEDSQDALAGSGVGCPIVGRSRLMSLVLGPLGWRATTGFSEPVGPARLRRLARVLRETPGDVLFLSCEDLAEAGPEPVEALGEVAAEADLDVRPVVSARSWARQLPSEYQQFVKASLALTFEEFLDRVRHRTEGEGERFWLRQALPEVCARWSAIAHDGRVDVVPVPSPRHDAEAVFRAFAEVVGFPLADLKIPTRPVNPSFGAVEIEVFRRFNAALSDRITSYEEEYRPIARQFLIRRKVLPRSASAPLSLSPAALDWVAQLGEAHLAELRSAGHRLHGDPSLLVAGPDDARGAAPVDDAAVADAAVEALVRAALRHHREQQNDAGR